MKRGPFDANQPNDPRDDSAMPPGIPDDLIDSICDGDMPRSKMRDALDALHLERNTVSDYHWTADALDALRADMHTPDMSEIILARTGMQRSWLSTVMRRKMVIGRVVGVAAVLTLIAGAFLIQRAAPETFTTDPTPVRELAAAVPHDAIHAASIIAKPVAYTVPAAPIDDEACFMPDSRSADTWGTNLLTMDSLRDLWPSRSPAPYAMPQITPVGFTPGTMALIVPVLPEEDRASSAAITAGQR